MTDPTINLIYLLRSRPVINDLDLAAADRLKNQAARITELQKFQDFVKRLDPHFNRVVLNAIKQDTGTSNKPSEEVEGDWV